MPTAQQEAAAHALQQAEAAHNDADFAVEAARLTGCPLAVFIAKNRRARAYAALLGARAATDPAAARAAQLENDHQGAGYASLSYR